MAKRRKSSKQDETLVDIMDVKDQAQNFIDRNQRTIIGAAAVILLLVGAYFGYKHLIQAPKQAEAVQAMTQAQNQFEKDSFALALENPGVGAAGFLQIIDDYGSVPAGNLAKYYAGICYLQLGRYEDAIDYLNDYKAHTDITKTMKSGALGDAYSEQGKYDQALTAYKKAADVKQNDLLTPYYLKKYALLAHSQGQKDKALAAFKTIRDEYPTSNEGLEADKYIALFEG